MFYLIFQESNEMKDKTKGRNSHLTLLIIKMHFIGNNKWKKLRVASEYCKDYPLLWYEFTDAVNLVGA
jgi:hypothetical protein